MPPPHLLTILLLFYLLFLSLSLRPSILLITDADLNTSSDDEKPSPSSSDFDDFINPNPDPDPTSWRQIIEHPDENQTLTLTSIRRLISASSSGDSSAFESAISYLISTASAGDPHAQSTLGFVFGAGIFRTQSRSKSFLYHQFAAEYGSMESKMIIAYYYFCHGNFEKAVDLYAVLVDAAIASFLISKDPLVIEPVRIHSGSEENKEVLKKLRGEANEDFIWWNIWCLKEVHCICLIWGLCTIMG